MFNNFTILYHYISLQIILYLFFHSVCLFSVFVIPEHINITNSVFLFPVHIIVYCSFIVNFCTYLRANICNLNLIYKFYCKIKQAICRPVPLPGFPSSIACHFTSPKFLISAPAAIIIKTHLSIG